MVSHTNLEVGRSAVRKAAYYGDRGIYYAPFPLTPALSLSPSLRNYGVTGGERENRRQPWE